MWSYEGNKNQLNFYEETVDGLDTILVGIQSERS